MLLGCSVDPPVEKGKLHKYEISATLVNVFGVVSYTDLVLFFASMLTAAALFTNIPLCVCWYRTSSKEYTSSAPLSTVVLMGVVK